MPTGPLPYVYTFSGPAMKRLAASTLEATAFQEPYSNETVQAKSVWIVKDAGVYLFPAYTPKPVNETVFCTEELELYDFKGDDYIVMLPIDDHWLKELARGAADLRVRLDGDEVVIVLLV